MTSASCLGFLLLFLSGGFFLPSPFRLTSLSFCLQISQTLFCSTLQTNATGGKKRRCLDRLQEIGERINKQTNKRLGHAKKEKEVYMCVEGGWGEAGEEERERTRGERTRGCVRVSMTMRETDKQNANEQKRTDRERGQKEKRE